MPLETIYRQIAFHRLTKPQQKVKLQKDSEYKIAVDNLSTSFYHKKRTVGVTAGEEEKYKQDKAKLWNDYLEWAKANGLYEEVTPEQQLAEAELQLEKDLANINLIRKELNRAERSIIDKGTIDLKEADYKQRAAELSDSFYKKKYSQGVTTEEEQVYKQVLDDLWHSYKEQLEVK